MGYSVKEVKFLYDKSLIPNSLLCGWKGGFDFGLIDRGRMFLTAALVAAVGLIIFGALVWYQPSVIVGGSIAHFICFIIAFAFGIGSSVFLYCYLEIAERKSDFKSKPGGYGHDLAEVERLLGGNLGQLLYWQAKEELLERVASVLRQRLLELDMKDEFEENDPSPSNVKNAAEAKVRMREQFELFKRFDLADKRGWRAYKEEKRSKGLVDTII